MKNINITEIKGIGPKKAELLNSIGITTVEELLYYFPARYDFYRFYDDINDINESGKAVFYIEYDGKATRKYSPQTGFYVKWQYKFANRIIVFSWFNQPYMIKSLISGKKYAVKCDIECNGKLLTAVNPHLETKAQYSKSILEPVYKTPAGMSSSQLSGFIKATLQNQNITLEDEIPLEIRQKYDIPELKESLLGVHCPKDEESGVLGMKRFIFEEFFMFRIRQLLNKKQIEKAKASIKFDMAKVEDFFAGLPYKLTTAQKNAADDIMRDLAKDTPMNRIVQGDVGSGKTIVAFAACLAAKLGGMQSVIMAPTEVLARQHLNSFEEAFKNYDINAALLVGSITKKEKTDIKNRFAEGKIDVLIGTQAVLEDDVESENVGLVITDEQHRFGVRQRLNLKNKGKPVNMLVLTATPIPRTLSLVVYSDLDVSVIDEMPDGRIPIKTYCRETSARNNVYSFALNEIKEGRQIYVICPSVDDEDENKASVKRKYEALAENELKSVRCAMLYGAMKPQDKDFVMKRFASGEIDALISTTVVEVGVNVVNATVMIVENAEKFGLAQLHQLRGRVGRGNMKSYCILISDTKSDTAKARLAMLAKTNNGFEIANEDMRLRGQGEYFGLRQHGAQQFKLGELPRDALLFASAAEAVDFMQANMNKFSRFYEQAYKKAEKLNDNIVFN